MTTWDSVCVRNLSVGECAVFPMGTILPTMKEELPQAIMSVLNAEDRVKIPEKADVQKVIIRRLLKDGWEPFSATAGELHLRRIALP